MPESNDRHAQRLEEYHQKRIQPVIASDLMSLPERVKKDPDALLENARSVHEQSMVRLAHAIQSFQHLPYIFGANPHVNFTYQLCWNWFGKGNDAAPLFENGDLDAINDFFHDAQKDHGDFLPHLCVGISELRKAPPSFDIDFTYINKFLQKLCARRAAWRMLLENHIRVTEGSEGVFRKDIRPVDVAQRCYDEASQLCIEQFGDAPQLVIKGDTEITMEYTESHLQYVIAELLKNAMRATMEKQMLLENIRDIPPISLIICKGDDITMKIIDEGGGVAPEYQQKIWDFGWSSSAVEGDEGTECRLAPYDYFGTRKWELKDIKKHLHARRLAGWGFGLPLSKVFVEQLGGSINMVTMPGYGTDIFITLPHIAGTITV